MPFRTARLLSLCLGFTAALTAAALARAPGHAAWLDVGAPAAPVQLAPPVRASLCSTITPAPLPAGAAAAATPVLFRDRPGARLPAVACGSPGAVQRT